VVSIKDVAARAGVSAATVSNVLNRPGVVARETRARVQAAIDDLGFIRNESARQLRAGSSSFIGFILRDVTNPFFTDVARGAEDLVNEAGLAAIICNSDDQDGREMRYLDLLEQQRVRGILITPTSSTGERLAVTRSRGIPVVLVDKHAGGMNHCSVSVDDVQGGDLAVSHLISRGHERIAYVGGQFQVRQEQDRHDGAVRAVQRAGLSQSDLYVVKTPGLNVSSGRIAGAELAEVPASDRPTAVFCANDLLALGLLQEFTLRGLRVPQDFAIVGYDDIEFAASAAVPLSSIRQPRIQLGRAAAEMLLEESADESRHKHRQVVFQPELVVRQSTNPDAGLGISPFTSQPPTTG
jgi:LacI family transcriptional regulator